MKEDTNLGNHVELMKFEFLLIYTMLEVKLFFLGLGPMKTGLSNKANVTYRHAQLM